MRLRKTTRPPKATPRQKDELGRAVLSGRAGGMSWKALERVYGRSKSQLWRYAREQQMEAA